MQNKRTGSPRDVWCAAMRDMTTLVWWRKAVDFDGRTRTIAFDVPRPPADDRQGGCRSFGNDRQLPGIDRTGLAVERDDVSFAEAPRTDRARCALLVDVEVAAADQAHSAELPRDDRCVRRAAAGCGQHANRRRQAAEVVGGHLVADEDHGRARAERAGAIGIEHDSARRDADAGGGGASDWLGAGVGPERDASNRLEVHALEARTRGLRIDHSLLHEVHRNLERG